MGWLRLGKHLHLTWVLGVAIRLAHCWEGFYPQHWWRFWALSFILFQHLSTCSTPCPSPWLYPLLWRHLQAADSLIFGLISLELWPCLQHVLPYLKHIMFRTQPPPNTPCHLQAWQRYTPRHFLLPFFALHIGQVHKPRWAYFRHISQIHLFYFFAYPMYKFMVYLGYCAT